MKDRDTRVRDPEMTLVGQLAVLASCISCLVYLRHNDLLLYGDAVAHINIARRVFDSRTPGLLQLGTVWLPLPHLLIMPFVVSDWMWQTGVGGSIASMGAYILGTIGIFRLVRGVLSSDAGPDTSARAAAWIAAAIYGANPNVIYLETTAMTESLYLALFIWALVYLSESVRAMQSVEKRSTEKLSPLTKCGLCLAGASLTRYDGWFLALILPVAWLLVVLKSKSKANRRRNVAGFALLAVSAPALWIAYNAVVYRNPLEFANGPYSARAIEKKSPAVTHPGAHDLPTAASYFLKSGELNMADGDWGRLWLLPLLAGTAVIVFVTRSQWPLLLLWAPFPFYAFSVAYGGVPIYVPTWWPFSSYNLRYGLELLPAIAVFTAVTAYFLLSLAQNNKARTYAVCLMLILVAASYGFIWRAQPICFREAWANSRSRIAFETELAANLRKISPDSTLLMYLGDHVGALERAGIPLRRVINEGNHRPWQHPSDPDGLWERALANPPQYADYVVAMEGDPVARDVQTQQLSSMVVIRTVGEPAATIYWTHAATSR
jgi:4-amino-4-deoxy-L-arabinose transferase-like glycosyltransferase